MMERTDNPGIIEQRLLELAYTTETKITVPALAYYANCSIEDSERVLDGLVKRDRIQMEVTDTGTLEYLVPDRHRLAPRPEPLQRRVEIRPPVLPLALGDGRPASPSLAAVLSVMVPGAGQAYTGRWAAGILWFLLVTAGYVLFLPGVLLHVFCVGSAAGSAHRLNSAVYQHRWLTSDLAPRLR